MSKKKIIGITGGIIIVAALAVFTIPKMFKVEEVELVAEVPPTVTVEKPGLRTIELDSELIGTIEPDSIVYVTPLGAGEITSVNAQIGDQVQAGQLLCIIDTKQVESARISMETARISYEDANKNLNRYAVLHAAGDVSEADYQSLKDKVEMARLQYEGAKLGYDIQMESSQVTAPIAGRIENFNISVHDMVSQQTVLCVIAGEGSKGVTFYASERIVNGLNAGDGLRVEKGGMEYGGTITEVGTMTDQASGLFKVKAAVSEGDSLPTGTSVKLYVTSQKAENVLTVSTDCVYYENGIPCVYSYEDGVLHKSVVTVGLADSSYIEIKDGLNADDQVVTTWTSELYDGSRVTLAETDTTVNVSEGTDIESSQSAE